MVDGFKVEVEGFKEVGVIEAVDVVLPEAVGEELGTSMIQESLC